MFQVFVPGRSLPPWLERVWSMYEGALPSLQQTSGSVTPQFQAVIFLRKRATADGTPPARFQTSLYRSVLIPASMSMGGRLWLLARAAGMAIGARGETSQEPTARLLLRAGPFVIQPPPRL